MTDSSINFETNNNSNYRDIDYIASSDNSPNNSFFSTDYTNATSTSVASTDFSSSNNNNYKCAPPYISQSFNAKNISMSTTADIDVVCPDLFSSSGKTKGCNFTSQNSSLSEASVRSTDGLDIKAYRDSSFSVDIPVPNKPFLELPHTFDVTKACGFSLKINELINRIECALIEKVEMSYEFDSTCLTWNVVYIKGSAHCKFQVHVYTDNDCLFVEIHKLCGDSIVFRTISKDIKKSISGVKQDFVESIFPISSMQPCDVLSDSDAFAAILVFKEMAAEPFVESQLEASRILCDLSQQEGMQHILRDSGCIQVLVNLASVGGTEWTRQHAVLALANLSSSLCCQEAIIDAGILPALLKLATDGPYHSAAMRRESARLLANISERLALRVIAVLGRQEIFKWFSSMDTFRDSTLRVHAQRARDSLSTVITASG